MGFFWQGLPPYLIEWSRDFLPHPIVAIETGTFQGDTSALLADAFGTCITIERSASLADAARARFRDRPEVTVLEGSSRDALASALPALETSIFFWLDAHGFYDYVGDDDQENPLLDELKTIVSLRAGRANVIAIDDARGMGVQPDWPPLTEVFACLHEAGYSAAIVDDTLVAVSASLTPDFYALYKQSRIVEVSSVFQIWPSVLTAARRRITKDALAKKINGALRR